MPRLRISGLMQQSQANRHSVVPGTDIVNQELINAVERCLIKEKLVELRKEWLDWLNHNHPTRSRMPDNRDGSSSEHAWMFDSFSSSQYRIQQSFLIWEPSRDESSFESNIDQIEAITWLEALSSTFPARGSNPRVVRTVSDLALQFGDLRVQTRILP